MQSNGVCGAWRLTVLSFCCAILEANDLGTSPPQKTVSFSPASLEGMQAHTTSSLFERDSLHAKTDYLLLLATRNSSVLQDGYWLHTVAIVCVRKISGEAPIRSSLACALTISITFVAMR